MRREVATRGSTDKVLAFEGERTRFFNRKSLKEVLCSHKEVQMVCGTR